MHGNISEWCANTHDPSNPNEEKRRVARGGSWHSELRYARAALRRQVDVPRGLNFARGVRFARDLRD